MLRGQTIFTVGHGRRVLPDFLDVLLEARVQVLVDVRLRPGSRRHPQFSTPALPEALAEVGILYRMEGEALGGFRQPRADSPHTALKNEAFRGYADHMETPEFRAAAARVLAWAGHERIALMCAETFPADCHRRLLSDWLSAQGADVIHLIEKGRTERHVLSPSARIDASGSVVYDAGRGRQGSLGF